MNAYWHVNDLSHFNNIMVHQLQGDLKYLACLSCQSAILGYQIISKPQEIYISCARVKLENEYQDEGEEGEMLEMEEGQYQQEFGDGGQEEEEGDEQY